jgi:outer membrane protein
LLVALAALLATQLLTAQIAPQPARLASPPAALAINYALEHNIEVRLNQLMVQNNSQVLRQSKAALLPRANLSTTQAWQYSISVSPLTFAFQS